MLTISIPIMTLSLIRVPGDFIRQGNERIFVHLECSTVMQSRYQYIGRVVLCSLLVDALLYSIYSVLLVWSRPLCPRTTV